MLLDAAVPAGFWLAVVLAGAFSLATMALAPLRLRDLGGLESACLRLAGGLALLGTLCLAPGSLGHAHPTATGRIVECWVRVRSDIVR